MTSQRRRYRGRKSDKLQCRGFYTLISAALIGGSLLEDYPIIIGVAVLAVMVLAGGYLVWLSNR